MSNVKLVQCSVSCSPGMQKVGVNFFARPAGEIVPYL